MTARIVSVMIGWPTNNLHARIPSEVIGWPTNKLHARIPSEVMMTWWLWAARLHNDLRFWVITPLSTTSRVENHPHILLCRLFCLQHSSSHLPCALAFALLPHLAFFAIRNLLPRGRKAPLNSPPLERNGENYEREIGMPNDTWIFQKKKGFHKMHIIGKRIINNGNDQAGNMGPAKVPKRFVYTSELE